MLNYKNEELNQNISNYVSSLDEEIKFFCLKHSALTLATVLKSISCL